MNDRVIAVIQPPPAIDGEPAASVGGNHIGVAAMPAPHGRGRHSPGHHEFMVSLHAPSIVNSPD